MYVGNYVTYRLIIVATAAISTTTAVTATAAVSTTGRWRQVIIGRPGGWGAILGVRSDYGCCLARGTVVSARCAVVLARSTVVLAGSAIGTRRWRIRLAWGAILIARQILVGRHWWLARY